MTTTFAMMYPVLIQVISCTVAPSVPIMCGSATATIDESIAPMRVPNVIDTVTSHLFGLGRAIRIALTTDELEKEAALLAMGVAQFAFRRPGAPVSGNRQGADAGAGAGHGSVAGGCGRSPPS